MTQSVRRSARARQQPTSAYDEELKQLAEKKVQSQESDSEASDVENEVREALMEEDDMGSDEKEDLEEFQPGDSVRGRRGKAKQSSSNKPRRTIQVKVGGAQKKKTGVRARGGRKNRRGVQNALATLSKKVLDSSETPETSLLAALLASAKPIPGFDATTTRTPPLSSRKATMYTPQLDAVARRLVDENEQNGMHLLLVNLLLRSVGGSIETILPNDTDLEDLDDNEWDTLVTDVVQVMRESDADLLTANPDDRLGPREFRAIYEEFWYRLGVVVLSHTPGSNDGHGDKARQEFSSSRFQVESVRELVARMTEFVMVGQPDLRAGATIAVWELAKACLERTVELEGKLVTAKRQHAASKGQSRKQNALQNSMDTWKRHKAELEAVVEESIIQGVFIHRYRDSNPNIRCQSLEALCQLTFLRPDIFLKDKYLKYFGWMASDKVDFVRSSALHGLLAPFKQKPDSRPSTLLVDLEGMQNVCSKFLPRVVECTNDSQSLEVQELAMELLLKMLQEGFLDDWTDDEGWDQVNMKALDPSTTEKARKDALYFVFDQLDCFDEGDTDTKSAVSVHTVSEKRQIERLDGVAGWIANKLCDGPIEIDKIKIHLADHVVQSMREMPEHRQLVSNWSAILKAIRNENPQQGRALGREELAKQRVLLRILACAAGLELGDKKEKKNSATNNEALSVALLKSLPTLLTSFKGDVVSLRSLCRLPQFLVPEVYSLPARKSDFQTLIKNLCYLFLECTDEDVLRDIAQALSRFVQGDHTRVSDVKMQVKRVSQTIQERLMELLAESDPQSQSIMSSPASSKKRKSSRRRTPRSSDSSSRYSMSSDGFLSHSKESEVEHSIYFCFLRFRVLLKLIPLAFFFEETTMVEDDDNEVEGFCKAISEAIGKRLMDRKPIMEDAEGEVDSTSQISKVPEAWKTDDMAIHEEVAKAVGEALQILLCIVSWKLAETLKEAENQAMQTVDPEELLVLRLRDRLVKLVGLCYEQFLEEREGELPDERLEFAASVQSSAGRVASDVRTLFPKEWMRAADPIRRELALTNDSQLIGGFVRYMQSREGELAAEGKLDDGEPVGVVNDLLVPLARALTANWMFGNRKEAGVVLFHLAGSCPLAGQTVHSMARMLKKINPVRFLESQMASLRLAFQTWLDSEPEEIESENPTEQQVQEFEEAEKLQATQFQSMEQLASRLSLSLGVGKLHDVRLAQALLNFLLEGIRFAFEGDSVPSSEDDLVLGSRLPFLLVLSKYSSWLKKNKEDREALEDFLRSNEEALRAHAEYNEVHEDDLQAIASFRESFGISAPTQRSTMSPTNDEGTDGGPRLVATPSGTPSGASVGSKRRLSTTSSQRSRMSTQSNLSPLIEEEAPPLDDENDEAPSPKRKRLASHGAIAEESRSESDASSPF